MNKYNNNDINKAIIERVKAIILVTLIFLVFFSGYKIYEHYNIRHVALEPYEEIQATCTKNDEEEGFSVDMVALSKLNEDIIGYIYIPGTNVSYPLLRGETNDEYVRHDYNHKYNIAGSVFMDSKNSPDLRDMNTVIYGHNMSNGSMFATLQGYAREEEYYVNRDRVYIFTLDGVYEYKMFSAFHTDMTSDVYLTQFATQFDYISWVNKQNNAGGFDDEKQFYNTKNTITLSTCYGNTGTRKRTVIIAELIAKHYPDYQVTPNKIK